MNRVDVTSVEIEEPAWASRAADFALIVMNKRLLDGWDLSIAFTDDATMRSLNQEWRGKDEPTDILSFQLGETLEDPVAGKRFLPGDIIISLDSLSANALYFSVDRDEELKRLIIHGILHLSGMDHEDNEPDKEMLRLQEELLADLAKERIL